MQFICMQVYAKRDRKDFEIRNFGQYRDLYLKNDTLLLAAFENFRKMCLKIYHPDPAKFLLAPGISWHAPLKKTEVKIRIVNQY